jgi:lipopolysaccharide biosynthesis glycosyltransferase
MKANVIVFATDGEFLPPAAFLAAKLAALNPRDDTEIVLFCSSVPDLDKAASHRLPATLGLVQETPLPELVIANRITPATFLRLLVPLWVSPEVRRILYLDADVYPENADVFRLFDLDMSGHPLAAVREIKTAYGETETTKREVDDIAAGRRILNAGVLLMDRELMLQRHIGERAITLARDRQLHDQWALNLVLAGDWLEMSPAMNLTRDARNSLLRDVVSPAVTHFSGPVKPWHGTRFGEVHPARGEIEHYLLASPWKSFLGAHFDFNDAWNALQGRRGLAVSERVIPLRAALPNTTDVDAVWRYLRETRFADVEQGISAAPVLP